MTRASLFEILNGDGKLAHKYGRFMCVVIIVSLLPLAFKDAPRILDIAEWICVSIFIIDYLARWATADLYLKRGAASFAIYPFTPMAIIDLLSILPAFTTLNPAWRAMRVLRMIGLVRAFKLIRYSKGAAAVNRAIRSQKEALLTVLFLALAYVFVSALVAFNVEPNTFDSFYDALYWAMVSLSTVGYGDLYLVSPVGRAIAMISSFVGVAIVALPAGIFTAGLMNELNNMGNNGKNDADEASTQGSDEQR